MARNRQNAARVSNAHFLETYGARKDCERLIKFRGST
jgi:hypothetical protein